ncbi:phage antirepressor [Clostridium tertium]|uniref:phage antirepressor n=1 Tax=Clostridium tertium TaxID=1559 RepID=UPI002FE49965
MNNQIKKMVIEGKKVPFLDEKEEVRVFKNKEFGFSVRGIELNGQGWLIGKDVAEALGYVNASKAVSCHVDIEDRILEMIAHSQNGKVVKTQTTLINESGLYSLILSSKLQQVKKFKRWVTSEVLPSIRRHGAYMNDDTLEKALTSPDFLIQLATNLKEEQEKRKLLEEEIKTNAPKVIFADAVSTSHTSILVGELAKLLKQNGVDTGQNKLFIWLRENGYLIKRKGSDYNMPTQRAMEQELFEIKETPIVHSDGHITVSKTTKVTGKGQQYFINKFIKSVS